ncbi:MAG: hypothetical protein J7J52_02230 [Deltaproteobacteria bacterium]|nr:hypothetical protein [Deltaproteobacteria bacterium]
MKQCDRTIKETIKLTEKMLSLAERGEQAMEDNGCALLYSVLRDSGYKIKKLAEQEKQAHIKKGWWKE